MLQGIPTFRDFTIRDPRYLFFRKKKYEIFFGFFEKIPIYSFLFVCSDCHLMNIKISLLDTTIKRNSLRV